MNSILILVLWDWSGTFTTTSVMYTNVQRSVVYSTIKLVSVVLKRKCKHSIGYTTVGWLNVVFTNVQ